MTTIISTVLIAAPIAFIAGWILAKAFLRAGGATVGKSAHEKLLQQQRQAITERDGQIAELHAELDKAAAKMLQSKQKFRTWRERIRPIAKQFRQQRAIITELRDELRRRDTEQQTAQQQIAQQQTAQPQPARPAPPTPERSIKKATQTPVKKAAKKPAKATEPAD